MKPFWKVRWLPLPDLPRAGCSPLSVSSLEIWADGGKLVKTKAIDGATVYATEADPLVVTPATPTSKLFLTLRDENGAANNYHFKATAGGFTYAYEGSKNLQYGHYYAGDVAMTMSGINSMPLTIEAKADGVEVRFDGDKTIEYSTDGGANWISYTNSGGFMEVMTTLANAGDKILIRGNNASYNGCEFNLWDDCYVYGNIMSLISPTGFSTLTTLTGDHNFAFLFDNGEVFSHPTIPLLLPATTLTVGCYEGMFSGTKLTTAPDLPATTLTNDCYENMFMGCTNLTTVPSILPATTLTDHCYDGMFMNCSSLTAAPILPAETLTSFCYSCMFNGCTNLTSIVCLAKNKLDEYDWSFYEWGYFGTSGGTLYIHPDLVLATDPATFPNTLPYPWDWEYEDPGYTSGPYDGIPHGWTVTKYNPAP